MYIRLVWSVKFNQIELNLFALLLSLSFFLSYVFCQPNCAPPNENRLDMISLMWCLELFDRGRLPLPLPFMFQLFFICWFISTLETLSSHCERDWTCCPISFLSNWNCPLLPFRRLVFIFKKIRMLLYIQFIQHLTWSLSLSLSLFLDYLSWWLLMRWANLYDCCPLFCRWW